MKTIINLGEVNQMVNEEDGYVNVDVLEAFCNTFFVEGVEKTSWKEVCDYNGHVAEFIYDSRRVIYNEGFSDSEGFIPYTMVALEFEEDIASDFIDTLEYCIELNHGLKGDWEHREFIEEVGLYADSAMDFYRYLKVYALWVEYDNDHCDIEGYDYKSNPFVKHIYYGDKNYEETLKMKVKW